ncbi:4Fe-4S binding protein [Deferribacteraceae bacterium V6Fe1]|nr:4Fe-4S binding protein [Deferribacteraceae bacterium V6Fe1]
MAIKFISGCIGCKTCIKTCPTDVIRISKESGKAIIKYPEDCQICHLCRLYCPVDAITITPEKSIPVIVSWG